MHHKQSFLASLGHACNGLLGFFSTERNGRIQVCFAIIALAAAACFGISDMQWLVVLMCIALVLSLEMMNSAVEKLCDLVHKDYHPAIKVIKDVAAASVLLSAIVSAIAGLIIFLPKIIALL